MGALPLIIGIGIVAFGILYFAFKWDKDEHIFLRLIASFVFISLLFLIPKAAYDYRSPCDFVVSNETVTGSVTTYEYDYTCAIDEENGTALTFYKAYTVFSVIFVFYFFIYLIWSFFMKPGGIVDNLLKRSRRK